MAPKKHLVDFTALKPVKEKVEVSFMPRNGNDKKK